MERHYTYIPTHARNLYIAKNQNTGYKALILATDQKAALTVIERCAPKSDVDMWKITQTYLDTLESCIKDITAAPNFYAVLLADDPKVIAENILLADVKTYLLQNRLWFEKNFIIAQDAPLMEMVMTFAMADGVDIQNAAIKACTEYCSTEKGKEVYKGNLKNFNWSDLDLFVPNEICEKYGFRKISCRPAQVFDLNEQLVNESDIFPEEED
jgi:hypothetical protein